MLKHSLTLLALVLVCCAPALAQGDGPLRLRVADALRAHEPAWLFNDTHASGVYSDHCKCEMATLEWKQAYSASGTVLVFVYSHEYDGDARATYESLIEDWALEKADELSRPDLGVAHLRSRAGESQGVKFSQLLLRKGRVAVVLWGLDTEVGVAERFASLIAAQLPAA